MMTNSHHTTLYIGVTSDLFMRTTQHREKIFMKSFTGRYNLDKLIYYEIHDTILDAIEREKKLKGASRKKKEALINEFNPERKDLYQKDGTNTETTQEVPSLRGMAPASARA